MDARDWAEKRKPYIEGKRNDHVYLVAQRCKEKGLSQEMTLFLSRRDFTDLPDYEIVSTVKSAYNHTPNPKPRTPSPKKKGGTDTEAMLEWIPANYESYYDEIYEHVQLHGKGDPFHPYNHRRDGSIIWGKLQQAGIACVCSQVKNILYSALSKDRNPIRAFFEEDLETWNQTTDFVKQVADNFETADNEFFLRSLTKWTVGMIAAVLEDKTANHNMFILSSDKQGIGKTRFFSHFLPDALSDYYSEGIPNVRDKDAKLLMDRVMLINLDELKAFDSAAERNNLKALLTMTHPIVRKPYGEVPDKLILRASFCATTNDPQFITDLDGSRRHYVHIVNGIKNYDMKIPNGFWAQCFFLYKSGFRYWDTQEEIDRVMKRNEQFRIVSLEEGLVRDYIRKPDNLHPGEKLSISQIVKRLSWLTGLKLDGKAHQTIGKILTKEGYNKSFVNGHPVYDVWILSTEQLEAEMRMV